VHRAHHEPNRADEHAAVHQDRRLPRGLRLLPQSVRYGHRARPAALLEVAAVREHAARAKAAGATRFAWCGLPLPKARDLQVIVQMVARGTCTRARELRHPRDAHERAGERAQGAGLDTTTTTSTLGRLLPEIITTRSYQDRLDTSPRCVRRDSRCLRRHHRHGRVERRSRRAARARWPICPRIQRAYRSSAGEGPGTRSLTARTWIRSISCAPSRSRAADAAAPRAPVGRTRGHER